AFSRLLGREPGIPVEGVKIARHMMFVDASRAQRELGFAPGSVTAALERAVRWYEANGYVAPRRARKIAQTERRHEFRGVRRQRSGAPRPCESLPGIRRVL